ncbi:MAG: DUF4407 domain-containing protein [Cyclobacteriaceae bacterium]
MKNIEAFFLYCSGVSLSILSKCSAENSKYVGIGGTIFFTGLLAAISAGYALYTVFESYLYALLFGLIWGLMIFNLDRYIVSSMRKSTSRYKELYQAIPRFLLAILIALVISKPLELKVFEKEISTELSFLKEEIIQAQQRTIRSRFSSQVDSLNHAIQLSKQEIAEKEKHRDALFEIARQEADGSGGSGKINPGPIYQIKQANALRVQAELDQLRKINDLAISQLKSEIANLNSEQKSTMAQLGTPNVSGLSFQLTALNRLGKKHPAILITNWFIIILFIALEITPILTKLISSRGPYDDLLQVYEHRFKNYRKEKIASSDMALEKNLANA